MRIPKPTVGGSLLFLAVVLGGLALGWALRPRPVPVEVAVVTRGTFVKSIDEDGKTRVRERYVVSAPLAGRLLRVELAAGDAVQPGTEVATLVPSEPALLDVRAERELNERLGVAEARKASTSAAIERQKAALALARSELARVKELGNRGFISQQAVDRAEREAEIRAKDLAVSEFDDHAAQHEVALARAALSDARRGGASSRAPWVIRSPVAGRVLRVVQESEAVVPIGAPLLEIGDPHDVEAVVDVLTTDAESIRAGAPVTLDRAPGLPPLAGRVRLVEPSAFTKVSALGVEEQRVNVVIDVLSDAASLGDGYRVDAHIEVDRRDHALLVPVGALFREKEGWAVFVADRGRAHKRTVTVGPRNTTFAVVEDGLAQGTTVVVYPPDVIRDKVRIRARPQ